MDYSKTVMASEFHSACYDREHHRKTCNRMGDHRYNETASADHLPLLLSADSSSYRNVWRKKRNERVNQEGLCGLTNAKFKIVCSLLLSVLCLWRIL